MIHLHEVRDQDTHYRINPVTMEIEDNGSGKNELNLGDHNSEIYTFEIPKVIEGHDMTLCNLVQVHFINIGTTDKSKDVYTITDMEPAADDADTLVFSWPVSGSATMYSGNLNYRIKFACLDENGNYTYRKWTDIYKGITVGDGFDNGEGLEYTYSDVLSQWEARLDALEHCGGSGGTVKSVNGIKPDENGNVEVDVGGIELVQGIGDSETHAMSQNAVTNELYESVNVQFEVGSIQSANGTNTDSTTRIRSGFVDITAFSDAQTDESYKMYVYFYDINDVHLGQVGWISHIKSRSIVENNSAIAKVRFVIKNTENPNGTTIVPDDITGHAYFSLSKIDKVSVKAAPYYGLPIIRLTGDVSTMTKDNAVPLTYSLISDDGHTVSRTGECTCKWQGNSSVRLGYPKRNYTIKLDEAFNVGYGKQKKYCLKANWIDPSMARNVVSARLWGQVVASRANVPAKLATAPNYGAINGMPCVIEINGEFEGLYTLNIPKDGWMFGMGEGTAEYIVAGESNSRQSSMFREEPTFAGSEVANTLDFSVEYKPDDVSDDTVKESFKTAVNAVRAIADGATWENAVAEYIDVDSVIDYYIFICCISGHDNLSKNILYATFDGVKWLMSAYDLDTTYGSNPYGKKNGNVPALYSVKNDRTQFYEAAAKMHKLFSCVYHYSCEKLKARYKELRSTVLSDENVWYEFNNFINTISRNVYNMDAEKWQTMPGTSTANIANYMNYYRMHCAYLDKEIEAL